MNTRDTHANRDVPRAGWIARTGSRTTEPGLARDDSGGAAAMMSYAPHTEPIGYAPAPAAGSPAAREGRAGSTRAGPAAIGLLMILSVAVCGAASDARAAEVDDPVVPETCLSDGVVDETDTDGDGLTDCEELVNDGTNPRLPDSDGDGIGDLYEGEVFTPGSDHTFRNPRVSDLPRIAVELQSVPQIELTFTESTGNTRAVATSHDTSTTEGVSSSRGSETSRQLEIGHTITETTTERHNYGFGLAPKSFDLNYSYEESVNKELAKSTTETRSSSANWTSGQRRENSRAWGESETIANEIGTTFTGGKLRVVARIRNPGNIDYEVENLTLSAVLYDPARPFAIEPIGNLVHDENSSRTFNRVVRSNKSVGELNFSRDLTLSQAKKLLRDSRHLKITPATYRLLDIDERSILLRDQNSKDVTAEVTIDFGLHEDRVESHRVAVIRGGGSRSIDALTALRDVLGFDVSEGSGSWRYGDEAGASATHAGLLGVDGVALSSDADGYWFGVHHRHNTTEAKVLNLLVDDYSLSDIRLRARDTLAFVYVTDRDRDALPDRYELEYGTDPDNADTDGDGLEDALEIYGTDLSAEPCSIPGGGFAKSDPLLVDSDADGIDDWTEVNNCDNPNFRVIADAGADRFVRTGDSVTLRGRASGGFDGQATYTWRLRHGPDVLVDGSRTRTLEGKSPTFTAPAEVSTLQFDLEVTVGEGSSSDSVRVQVQRDPATAYYVGRGDGDARGDGSIDAPYETLEWALQFLPEGSDLYVQTRFENGEPVPYTPANPLLIPDGTSIYGGYGPDWVRDADSARTPVTLHASFDLSASSQSTSFQSMSFPGTGVDVRSVFAYPELSKSAEISGFILTSEVRENPLTGDIAALTARGVGHGGELHVMRNTLVAGDAVIGQDGVAGSSYGARFHDLALLRLEGNDIRAGKGSAGGAGEDGREGLPGYMFVTGVWTRIVNRPPDRGLGVSGGGAGGAGGAGSNSGGNGTAAGDASGGLGGRGGTTMAGENGENGVNGEGGRPALRADSAYLPNSLYVPSDGYPGKMGTGGGGGGGGGSGDGYRTLGGTGGRGGNSGEAGKGGAGGGASIGVLIDRIGTVDMRDNRIAASDGGTAGAGGSGGAGGFGRSGFTGSYSASPLSFCIHPCHRDRGGNGGNGGRGGRGGDGSGGSGGPSIALHVGSGLVPILVDNTLTTGNGGGGGDHGHGGPGGDSIAIVLADGEHGLRSTGRDNAFYVGQGGDGGVASGGGAPGETGCTGEINCR